jgi:hypothetical protein
MKSIAPSQTTQIARPYSFDDRVTEDIFDIEDERAEVEIIVHGMMHDEN